ncbi:MAG TPA: hypothetical protein VFS35_04385, partial [Terrimicrobiaceae bacterium]|nr:hypothetical protein [Terrimicrobiaceae bacterium]
PGPSQSNGLDIWQRGEKIGKLAGKLERREWHRRFQDGSNKVAPEAPPARPAPLFDPEMMACSKA